MCGRHLWDRGSSNCKWNLDQNLDRWVKGSAEDTYGTLNFIRVIALSGEGIEVQLIITVHFHGMAVIAEIIVGA